MLHFGKDTLELGAIKDDSQEAALLRLKPGETFKLGENLLTERSASIERLSDHYVFKNSVGDPALIKINRRSAYQRLTPGDHIEIGTQLLRIPGLAVAKAPHYGLEKASESAQDEPQCDRYHSRPGYLLQGY